MNKFPLMKNNISRQDLDAVISHLQQDDPRLTSGPFVDKFEREWSKWLGTKYSVFVNSGASANLLSMALLRLKYPEGGEVIVPPLTWVSDIASVMQHGFDPVFVDIDPRTLSMDTAGILGNINDRTRAVFLTHAQGFDGLTDELVSELEKLGVALIEDVCESHGAQHSGCRLGSVGWISNFSFYYAHHMSTIEGGMISTNDFDAYQKLRMLRSHGMVRESNDELTRQLYRRDFPDLNPEFIFAFPAYNVRPTEIGGIIGCSQLERIDSIVSARTENFKYFLSRLSPNIYRTDFKVEGSSNYAFNVILKNGSHELAQKLMVEMSNNGIEFRRGSAGGGNQLRQPYLTNLFPKDYHKKFPNVEHIHFFGFYIGNYPGLQRGEIDRICDILNSIK